MSVSFAGTIAGRIDGRQDPVDYGVDETTRSLPVNLRVWDTDLLQWVRMTQPVSEGGAVQELQEGIYLQDIRYDNDSDGNCKYKGMNTVYNESESAETWYIIRYDYTDGNCTRKRYRLTSWTNRTVGW